jgi:hypothetical protein
VQYLKYFQVLEYLLVGSGETSFTIEKGDTYKNVTITIVGEVKETASLMGIEPSLNYVSGYKRETVKFGNWPQSLADVTGVTLTVTGKIYDGKNAEYSGDDGNKYVKVDDSYYKVEPITWRIIAYNSDGSKRLLADKIYSCIPYSADYLNECYTIPSNNYKYSNIRAYLNSTKNQYEIDYGTPRKFDVDWTGTGFLTTAFTSTELEKIKTVLVDNSAATTANSLNHWVCENTEDKVYLLSYKDATKKLYGLGNAEDRIMKATDYARANGAFQSSSEGFGGIWWLRSPYDNLESNSCFVLCTDFAAREKKNFYDARGDYLGTNSLNPGVVPALTVLE